MAIDTQTLWKTYEQELQEISHVIQFCNNQEPSIEKRAALAAAIILNANCFKVGFSGGACSFAAFDRSQLVASCLRVKKLDSLQRRCAGALPSAAEIKELLQKDPDERTYLDVTKQIDTSTLINIVSMQSAIIVVRAKAYEDYSDTDLERMSTLLQKWPQSLSGNQDLQKAFTNFSSRIVAHSLNDVRSTTAPICKVINFINSHPEFFTEQTRQEVLNNSIKACSENIEKTNRHNRISENKVTPRGEAVLQQINLQDQV